MNLFNIFDERKKQLKIQETIDSKLKECNCICPTLVSEYLLLQRHITRNQQYKVINTNLLGIYDEMNNQLKVNNAITDRFLKKEMNCQELHKIVLEGNKII